MNAADIIHEVTRRGCNITVQDDTLKLSAPRPLPDGLMDEIRQHKPEVIAQLAPGVSEVRLTIITCRHCGSRYWHHLGDLATDGKIAGGPCCFGHEVLTVAKYPTEAAARPAWVKRQDAGVLPGTQKAVTGEMVRPSHG